MDGLGKVSERKVLGLIAATVILGGIVIGVSGFVFGTFGSFTSSEPSTGVSLYPSHSPSFVFGSDQLNGSPPDTFVVRTAMTMTSTTFSNGPGGGGNGSGPSSSFSGVGGGGGGGSLEFSSSLTVQSPQPSQVASEVVALAYSVGGYVAYQSTVKDSAYVVVRVPAASYQNVLSQIKGMGNVTTLSSNSNDVTVQYTDLNATLKSLQAEQFALLRLVNQSTSINNTLAIESQLQSVDSQINSVQSQILQTRTLIQYSTFTVTVTKEPEKVPLSVALSATPKSGPSPLSVTLNAIVKGGVPNYYVDYNFGDGSDSQGQVVVHRFSGAGDYNVTVSVTDSSGASVVSSEIVHVSQSGGGGLGSFFGTVYGLFVSVVEGIVEVAAVVIPIGLVALAVLYPFQRRARAKQLKQSP
ncbi:MAG: DUF4349 domain-containing protein [Thaumarchaeota archaeon]|nr:DUF4349 domain-containing protein [Nitrososphaerota archaeon]